MGMLGLLLAGLITCTCIPRLYAAEVVGSVQSPALASTVVLLYSSDGQKRQSYLAPDGKFSFSDVQPGSHLLQVSLLGHYYPEYQIDVGKSGVLRATLIAQGPQGSIVQPDRVPLVIRPAGEMHYFERRKPVDVWSFIKSPYGLMVAFSLIIIVVMPRLKVDPEELKEMQAQLRGAASGSQQQQQQQRIAAR